MQKSLFDNYKYCERCNRPLPTSHEGNVCDFCLEQELFQQVKEYIRANNVTEYDVVEHFNIPHRRVKNWIHQGRIEYKDDRLNAITGLFCKKCGAPITFGVYCSKCQANANVSGHSSFNSNDDGHMRFIDKE